MFKSFRNLGAQFNPEASCEEKVKARLAIARHRMSELAPWKAPRVNKRLKARLMQALVLPIVTYSSEAWTLNKELCESIQAFGMQCCRRSMRISYTEHITNDGVLRRVGQGRRLMAQMKSQKLKYLDHVTRHNSLEKDVVSEYIFTFFFKIQKNVTFYVFLKCHVKKT